jgi:hypothetical protein
MHGNKRGARRTWCWVLVGCVGALVGFLLLRPGTPVPGLATHVQAERPQEAAQESLPAPVQRAPRQVVRSAEALAEFNVDTITRAPLIGQVTVEKSEVCPGEDLKISIEPAADAPETTFNIDGKFGQELIVSASMPDEESYWIVASRGSQRDFREVVVTVLSEQHPRCASEPGASIELSSDAWARDTYHLEAVPLRGLVDIVQVRWSFGDGESQSGGARVSHSYAERPQTGETSAFLVTAEVVDAEGRTAKARATVSMLNLHYQVRQLGGARVIPVQHERVVEGPANEAKRVAIRLNNIEEKPVRFERGQARLWSCSGQLREHSFAAGDLLDSTLFPAGQVSEAQVALPAAWTGVDVCRIELGLTGDTEQASLEVPETHLPARPVTADMTFELGMPKSVAQGNDPEFAGQPVTDPELEAALLEIMAEKGTNHVTQEELDQSRGRADWLE